MIFITPDPRCQNPKVLSRSSGNQLLRHLGDMPLLASSLDGPKFSHFAGGIRQRSLFRLFFWCVSDLVRRCCNNARSSFAEQDCGKPHWPRLLAQRRPLQLPRYFDTCWRCNIFAVIEHPTRSRVNLFAGRDAAHAAIIRVRWPHGLRSGRGPCPGSCATPGIRVAEVQHYADTRNEIPNGFRDWR